MLLKAQAARLCSLINGCTAGKTPRLKISPVFSLADVLHPLSLHIMHDLINSERVIHLFLFMNEELAADQTRIRRVGT